MNVVFFIAILIGSVLFFASACTVFITDNPDKKFFFYRPIFLIITAICYFISIMGFVVGMLYYHDNKSKNKPEYKLVTKQLYEQIK